MGSVVFCWAGLVRDFVERVVGILVPEFTALCRSYPVTDEVMNVAFDEAVDD